VGSLWVSVNKLWGEKCEKLGVVELEVPGQRVRNIIVFPWNVLRVEGGVVTEKESGQVACGVVMTFILYRIEGGVVKPPRRTTIVRKGEDVRGAGGVRVLGDGEVDGYNGC
jgi:hypothetical protein